MQLSKIKESVAGAAQAVADRVQANWKNMSTTGKVATIGSSVVLTGAAIAAVATHSLLIADLSAKVVFAVASGTAGLGMIVPATVFLRKPSEAPKAQQKEAPVAVVQKVLAEDVQPVAPIAKKEPAVVVETPKAEPVVVGPSRLKQALVVSAFATALIATAYFGMGAQGRESLSNDLNDLRNNLSIAAFVARTVAVGSKDALSKAIFNTSAADKKAFLKGLVPINAATITARDFN